jgi:hypothetical protein
MLEAQVGGLSYVLCSLWPAGVCCGRRWQLDAAAAHAELKDGVTLVGVLCSTLAAPCKEEQSVS